MGKSNFNSASPFKPLVDALDCGYQHSQAEMLRWMLSAGLELVGLKATERIPDNACDKVMHALSVYQDTVAAMPAFVDILGPCYMDLRSRWHASALGQYFTPYPIAKMMALMTHGQPARQEGLVTVCDPCCGSGVMLLATAQVILESEGPDALLGYSFTGIDLDGICARMTALQLTANLGVHALQLGEFVVYQGNSLMPWETLSLVIHATAPASEAQPPILPAMHPRRLKAIEQAGQMQLPLFEAA